MRTGNRRTTPAAPATGLEPKRRRTRRRPADEGRPRVSMDTVVAVAEDEMSVVVVPRVPS